MGRAGRFKSFLQKIALISTYGLLFLHKRTNQKEVWVNNWKNNLNEPIKDHIVWTDQKAEIYLSTLILAKIV